MINRKRLWVWTLVFMIGSLFGRTSVKAESMEYIDSAKQEKWEQSQTRRAEKAEHRRAFFNKWFEDGLEKLKPHRQPHADDQAAGTIPSMQTGSELK